ncbi:MOSC domain-containing protein [Agrobacterium fabrum]|uniref:MOSC domain-containing protein n=1 Tax=Agrobacterium fabrum TaxID=1176649 RepID=UPI00157168CC|nr:MOSC domain-containing protein [Agrobacterium fabrum]WIE28947.1 MOSC domain-containing protein [Agrobacterium fabrum]WIE44907.1 MOSC domain-containing protein [Agrobacterium fabrum]
MTERIRPMPAIGKIVEIWRYPVSSLCGEICHEADISLNGITGDRRFGLFDPESGVVAAPEKDGRWRPALFLKSAMDENGVRIGFPNGRWLYLEDSQLPQALSAHFGFEVEIGSYAAADPLAPSVPRIRNRYSVSPLHLVTTSSLCELQRMTPQSTIDRLRFRPNILLETEDMSGFSEFGWIGDVISFGAVEVTVTETTKRCGMTLIAQPELKEQPEILRTMLRNTSRALGIYCEPRTTGRIEIGTTGKKHVG